MSVKITATWVVESDGATDAQIVESYKTDLATTDSRFELIESLVENNGFTASVEESDVKPEIHEMLSESEHSVSDDDEDDDEDESFEEIEEKFETGEKGVTADPSVI